MLREERWRQGVRQVEGQRRRQVGEGDGAKE